MVFVFGIDIPLVELIFVLTLILLGLFGLMIYIIIKQYKLNQRLGIILNKENVELSNLKDIRKEEKTEARLLTTIRNELDKMIYGEIYGKKLESIMKKKGRPEKEKVKKLAQAFWKEMIKLQKEDLAERKKKQIIYGDIKKVALKPHKHKKPGAKKKPQKVKENRKVKIEEIIGFRR